ncbi:hypothetical protein AVEN_87103-1 [Araneus ventricosus]|uniref:Uncharacterized protein n=1 Tax=Araneus ventricosus TaxID=182803 RepID=A0A4Y2TFC8_ARAVE|nr:hypothetical protein AVEN_87103-1 [Araneus ventricosus]
MVLTEHRQEKCVLARSHILATIYRQNASLQFKGANIQGDLELHRPRGDRMRQTTLVIDHGVANARTAAAAGSVGVKEKDTPDEAYKSALIECKSATAQLQMQWLPRGVAPRVRG